TFCLGIAHDEKEVYQKLLEREKEGTTGIISGFAIPHAKSQLNNTYKSPKILLLFLYYIVLFPYQLR
ncbi:PTS sugar transporter subunit IIA, partial [Enterococcus faecium]|uniref:PTS sugar transporter subunit IIA n=1 Tax=Enterococcus faecium TaxID=1352 RepID=UPI003CC64EEC